MDSKMNITVLGSGNGGFATAADMKMKGHNVTLFELPEFEQSIQGVKEIGGINLTTLESSGLEAGFAKLDKITTDIEEALVDAELIMVVVPAFGQASMAKSCAPYLKDGQIIILHPGNFGGSIFFNNELKKARCNKNVIIGEMECLMYATRKENSTTSWIRGYKHNMGLAVFPSIKTDFVYDKMKQLYPYIVKRNNVLETGLSNLNTIAHIPIMLFNIGIIENKMDVLFYWQAFTNSIGKIVEKLDEERMSINGSGLTKLKPLSGVVKSWYEHQGASGTTIQEICKSNPIYPNSKVPTTLNHRYITEDVPYGLIPMIELVEKFGTDCPTLKSILNIAIITSETDLYENSRSLKSLNLDSFDLDGLKNYVTYGN